MILSIFCCRPPVFHGCHFVLRGSHFISRARHLVFHERHLVSRDTHLVSRGSHLPFQGTRLVFYGNYFEGNGLDLAFRKVDLYYQRRGVWLGKNDLGKRHFCTLL